MPRVVQQRTREAQYDWIDTIEAELAQPSVDLLAAVPGDERNQRDLVTVAGRQGGQ